MNIQEMHIEIRQGTQNIAANTRRKLQDEEIDWLLNKIEQRFIQSKIKPKKDGSGGFEIDQLDTDAIRPLLATKEILATVDNGDYKAHLPGNYSYLISDDSYVNKLCGTTVQASISVENILILPFPYSSRTTPKYYSTIAMLVGNVDINLTALCLEQGITYTGFNSKEEKYVLISYIQWRLSQMGVDAYWEFYKGYYKPNSFLFPNYTEGSLVVDSTTVTGTMITINNISKLADGRWRANRLTPGNKISTMMDTGFVTSGPESPISYLSGNYLTIKGNTSFTVSRVRIDYVRKSRRMCLSLGESCELPEEFHQSICDLVVEYYKAMVEDPAWEIKMKDNMLRSPSTS